MNSATHVVLTHVKRAIKQLHWQWTNHYKLCLFIRYIHAAISDHSDNRQLVQSSMNMF